MTRAIAPSPAHRVAVDARDARGGKPLAHFGLEPLGADARLLEELAAALATRRGTARRVVAVVAAHAPRGAMVT